MSRGRFVLFYNAPSDPDPSAPHEHGTDSLVDAVTQACHFNLGREEGGRALRIEQDGREILGEADLIEIAGEARAKERLMIAQSLQQNPPLTQINLSAVITLILQNKGVIDAHGEPILPEGTPPRPA